LLRYEDVTSHGQYVELSTKNCAFDDAFSTFGCDEEEEEEEEHKEK
jgi:hypothetical protein